MLVPLVQAAAPQRADYHLTGMQMHACTECRGTGRSRCEMPGVAGTGGHCMWQKGSLGNAGGAPVSWQPAPAGSAPARAPPPCASASCARWETGVHTACNQHSSLSETCVDQFIPFLFRHKPADRQYRLHLLHCTALLTSVIGNQSWESEVNLQWARLKVKLSGLSRTDSIFKTSYFPRFKVSTFLMHSKSR